MKITDIEVIPIAMPLAERYREHDGPIRMYDMDQHVVVKVHTDNGLVGYGDCEDHPQIPEADVERLIGRDPFDFIQNELHLALGMAMYDVMGKHLEVPAYKLMGQKVRSAVPAAAWTRPCSPEVFAEEIHRAAGQGYTIFKMHSCAYYDVIEQTKAAEAVAPPGFRIHWDFNHNRTLGAVLPIVEELQRNHPIVGFIEDPVRWEDIDGWSRLREKMAVPLVMHVPQLGGMQEIIRGVADIYMIGTRPAGQTLQTGFAYGKANIQMILQQSGNTLMKAFTLHQAAVLPTATAHTITLDDQYDEDITTEKIPVVEGFSRVPEGPGLGVEVDEEALARAAARKPLERVDFIGVLEMPDGHRIYTRGMPNVQGLTGYEEGAIRGIQFERWLDDGSEAYKKAHERVKREGSFVEAGA
ncbi:MAG: enolase C-terminal domain-like protein [Candidatus Latescibacteria bacterium]|nr:enolase C-terminal domain-like protein [Candidatus Latescibacterota bacterium]